jgi:hypothetical protein
VGDRVHGVASRRVASHKHSSLRRRSLACYRDDKSGREYIRGLTVLSVQARWGVGTRCSAGDCFLFTNVAASDRTCAGGSRQRFSGLWASSPTACVIPRLVATPCRKKDDRRVTRLSRKPRDTPDDAPMADSNTPRTVRRWSPGMIRHPSLSSKRDYDHSKAEVAGPLRPGVT